MKTTPRQGFGSERELQKEAARHLGVDPDTAPARSMRSTAAAWRSSRADRSGTACGKAPSRSRLSRCWTEPPIVKYPDGTLKTCHLQNRANLPLGKNPTLENWWFPPGTRIDVYVNGAVEAGFLESYSTFKVKPAGSPDPGPLTLKFVQGTQLVFTPKGYAY